MFLSGRASWPVGRTRNRPMMPSPQGLAGKTALAIFLKPPILAAPSRNSRRIMQLSYVHGPAHGATDVQSHGSNSCASAHSRCVSFSAGSALASAADWPAQACISNRTLSCCFVRLVLLMQAWAGQSAALASAEPAARLTHRLWAETGTAAVDCTCGQLVAWAMSIAKLHYSPGSCAMAQVENGAARKIAKAVFRPNPCGDGIVELLRPAHRR